MKGGNFLMWGLEAVIVLVLAVTIIPTVISGKRSANERGAQVSLRSLRAVQTAFKTGDSDGNGKSDYWCVTSRVSTTPPPPVRRPRRTSFE